MILFLKTVKAGLHASDVVYSIWLFCKILLPLHQVKSCTWLHYLPIQLLKTCRDVRQKLELQLQAIAARDITHGFLGYSYQSHFSNLGTTNCYFKIVYCECVLHYKRLNFSAFKVCWIFYVKFKNFISLF